MFNNALNHPIYFQYNNRINEKAHKAKTTAICEHIAKANVLYGPHDVKTKQVIDKVNPTFISQQGKCIKHLVNKLQTISARFNSSRPPPTIPPDTTEVRLNNKEEIHEHVRLEDD